MESLLYIILALIYLVFLIIGLRIAFRLGYWTNSNFLLFIIAALIYDNLIIACGKFIGEGALLESLNLLRYWLHGIVTPTIIIYSWDVIIRTGAFHAKRKVLETLAYLLTLGLIIFEITHVIGTNIKPKWDHGTLVYEPESMPTMPIMLIITTVILLIAGIIIWKKQGWKTLFIGVLLMGIVNIIIIWFKNPIVMNSSELVLMIALFMTKRFQDHLELKQDRAAV